MAVVDPARLLESLLAEPRETEWLEFKTNHFDADEIGRYVSGLANSAMLHDQEHGYLVFGVEDGTHKVVGTAVQLKAAKGAGKEPFEPWVARLLHPSVTFEIVSFEYDGLHVEIVRIHPAYLMPVRFKNEEYVRVDSSLKPLRDYPERARTLWAITSRFSFERGIAGAHLSERELFELFAVETLLDRMGVSRLTQQAMVERLLVEELIIDDKQGAYDATNLLAILAAKDVKRFQALARKVPRVIHYTGSSKLVAKDDVSGSMGIGISFLRVLKYIMDRVAHKEEMRHGSREMIYAIPEIAVRELVCNALIHQDLTSGGNGPLIEIFNDRIRITNPGKSLMDPDRLIDAPARSRNEQLASFMRRLRYCEERGSGVDRAVDAIEQATLAPPLFQAVDDSMVVTLFASRSFAAMSKEDRIRACYQHASVRWEASMPMSNQSLRNRFGMSDKQYPQVSLVIRDTIEVGLIRPMDEEQANRNARYVPSWVA